jgi:predicted RND superfamily exporter protein
MPKGLVGGMTSNDHEKLDALIEELSMYKENTQASLNQINDLVLELKSNDYWDSDVPDDFKSEVSFSLEHYKTTISELDEICAELQREVQEHHIKRLKKIAKDADDINSGMHHFWNNNYEDKNYGDSNFRKVEEIYEVARQASVALLNISSCAERLNNYIGKLTTNTEHYCPRILGSFYVVSSIFILITLLVVANHASWMLFPIIALYGVATIFTIGILQVRGDELVTDKSCRSLANELFKRLSRCMLLGFSNK